MEHADRSLLLRRLEENFLLTDVVKQNVFEDEEERHAVIELLLGEVQANPNGKMKVSKYKMV